MAKDPIEDLKDMIEREFGHLKRISHFLTEDDAKDMRKFVDKFNDSINDLTNKIKDKTKEQADLSTENKMILETLSKSLGPFRVKFEEILKLPAAEAAAEFDKLGESMKEYAPEIEKLKKNSEAINTLDEEKIKKTKELIEQEKRKVDLDNKFQKIARSHQTNIDNIFGKLGLAFHGSEDDPNPLFMLLNDLRKGQLDTDLFKAYLTMPGKIIKNFVDPLNIIINSFGLFRQKTVELFTAFDRASAQFLKATGLTKDWTDTLQDSWEQVKYYNISLSDMSESIQSLLENVRSFNDETESGKQKLSVYTSLVSRLGVGAADTTKALSFFKDTLNQGISESVGNMSELLGISKTTGDTLKDVVSAFNASIGEIAKYGNQANNVFRQMYGTAKALRIETSQLLQVSQGFDTFEEAATSVGRLNAILGGPYLNTLQMMNQNEAERVQTLNEMFKASGKSWLSLGKFQQQAIASAAGITDMNVAAKIFGGSMSDVARYTREAAIRQDELNEKNQRAADLSEKFQNLLLSFGKLFGPILDAIHSVLDVFLKLADFLGPAGFLSPILMWFAGTVLYKLVSGFGLVQKVTGGVIGAFKGLFSIFTVGETVAKAASDAITGVAPAIATTATNAAAAAPAVEAATLSLSGLSSAAPAIAEGIILIGGAIAIVVASFMALKQIAKGIGDFVENALGGIGKAIGGVYSMVGDFFGGLGKAWVGLFDSPAEDLLESLQDLGPNAATIMDSFGNMWEKVSKLKLSDVSASAVSGIGDLLNKFASISDTFSNGMTNAFLDSMSRFLNSVSGIQPEKVDNFKQITSNIVEMDNKLKDAKSSASLFKEISNMLEKITESKNSNNEGKTVIQIKIGDGSIIEKTLAELNKRGNVYSMGA